MKVIINRLKLLAVALIVFPLLAVVIFTPVSARPATQDFDAAAVYKAKCAMCHGPKAEKKFDPAKSDEELMDTVLKSNKPGMPAYETKGINAEQAKALVTYMKSLRQ